MSVTVAIRFPLGRFHATPWDRSVNEGAVEWPPSPWRLLRSLVATWYTRWPDLPAPVLDGLLDALGEPPSYRTPATTPGHTRHYLPDLDHRTGETGSTDLTLDPFLRVPRDAETLVRWDVPVTAEQRSVLAKLVELVPYLGRAESVCEMALVDDPGEPDSTWWRAGAAGDETARLLAPTRPVSRPVLEMTTVDVRKAGRTVPPATYWVPYARAAQIPPPAPRRRTGRVNALRFAVQSRAPVKATHTVLLADGVHRLVAKRLDEVSTLLGRGGAATDHQHAHWVPIPDSAARGAQVESFVVWAPATLSTEDIAQILKIRAVSGRRGDDYEVKGFPAVELLLQSAGPVNQVAPELSGPARVWRSLTPYLPVRHRKRESLDEFLTTDVQRELAYRHLPPAQTSRTSPEEGGSDRWALEFRRYRERERLGQARRGLGLRLEFASEVAGPLLLGQLSHFGFGIFTPEPA